MAPSTVQSGTLLSDSIRKLTAAASSSSSAASSVIQAAASSQQPMAIINPSLTSPFSTAYKLLLTSGARPLGSLLGGGGAGSAASSTVAGASSAAAAGSAASFISKAALKLPLLPLIPRGLRLAARPFGGSKFFRLEPFKFCSTSRRFRIPFKPTDNWTAVQHHKLRRRPYRPVRRRLASSPSSS